VDVPEVLDLSAPQARVLGCLMEKQATTPDAYPLTLKALVTACNQSTNRDPVVDHDASLVENTVYALKSKGLARVVHPGSGERATKYRQVADEALGLDPAEAAVLCVLLLRGPQTVAELKTRTERIHSFASTGEVDDVLGRLATPDGSPHHPFVMRVERQPGQKEARWIQLLDVDPEGRAAATVSAAVTPSARSGGGRVDELEARVAALESKLAALVEALGDLVELPED
jgi:uncharacterized protein YceH (UPF0502 family)